LWHSLALRADGIVVAWGKTLSAQCAGGVTNMGCGEEPTNPYPLGARLDLGDTAEGLTSRWAPVCPALFRPGAVRSIAAGGYRSLALLNDGSVLGWGDPINYPLPSVPGGTMSAPPVPLDLVGMRCVNGLTGIRVLNQTVPIVAMGDRVDLEIEIDKARGSQVPVSMALLDGEANGVSAEFKFASGSGYATRETKGTMTLRVASVPVGRVIPSPGPRTLRLLARSGDIAVETSFTINVLLPFRFEVVP
jgi:hypothetical protein